MPLSSDIEAVIAHHFASADAGVAAPERSLEEVEGLLRTMGFAPESGSVDRSVVRAVEGALATGVETDTILALAQAYARGLGRVVAAEADTFRRRLKDMPAELRADHLDGLLSTNLPLIDDIFQTLHHAMLRDALEDALTEESLAEPEVAERAIALVDVCDSTRYLTGAGLSETQQLVDHLFEAGRTAVAGRAVWVVKYVGDGVFLLGRSALELADAALHAIDVLESELPQSARAGLASGPVVRRAGDYFGLPINLAERLAGVAEPGTLLVAEPAASELPPERITSRKELQVRGVDEPVVAVGVERDR